MGFPGAPSPARPLEGSEAYVIQTGPTGDKGPEVGNVEANIVEFERIDPSAQGFRYGRNRAGARSLSDAPKLLNLRVLQEAMEPLANFLSGVSSMLQERAEYTGER